MAAGEVFVDIMQTSRENEVTRLKLYYLKKYGTGPQAQSNKQVLQEVVVDTHAEVQPWLAHWAETHGLKRGNVKRFLASGQQLAVTERGRQEIEDGQPFGKKFTRDTPEPDTSRGIGMVQPTDLLDESGVPEAPGSELDGDTDLLSAATTLSDSQILDGDADLLEPGDMGEPEMSDQEAQEYNDKSQVVGPPTMAEVKKATDLLDEKVKHNTAAIITNSLAVAGEVAELNGQPFNSDTLRNATLGDVKRITATIRSTRVFEGEMVESGLTMEVVPLSTDPPLDYLIVATMERLRAHTELSLESHIQLKKMRLEAEYEEAHKRGYK